MSNQKLMGAGFTGVLLLSLPLSALAAQAENDIAWGILIMELMGGLALFLAGLEQLSDGLKKVAGDERGHVARAQLLTVSGNAQKNGKTAAGHPGRRQCKTDPSRTLVSIPRGKILFQSRGLREILPRPSRCVRG